MGLGKEIKNNQLFRDEKISNSHAFINFHTNPSDYEKYDYKGKEICIKKATIIVLHDDYDIEPENFQVPSKGKLVLGKDELRIDPIHGSCLILLFNKIPLRPPHKMKLSKIDFWVDVSLNGTRILYQAFDSPFPYTKDTTIGILWDNRYCEALIP